MLSFLGFFAFSLILPSAAATVDAGSIQSPILRAEPHLSIAPLSPRLTLPASLPLPALPGMLAPAPLAARISARASLLDIRAAVALDRPAMETEAALQSLYSGARERGSLSASAGALNAREPGSSRVLPIKKILEVRRYEGLRLLPHSEGRTRVRALAFSSDGRTLYVGGAVPEILAFDVEGGRLKGRLRLKSSGAEDGISSLNVSRDGRMLLSAGPGQGLTLWSTRGGKLIERLGIADDYWWAEFGPNDDRIYGAKVIGGAHSDTAIVAWNVEHAGTRSFFAGEGYQHLDVSPDGRYVAGAGNGAPNRIWDARDGREKSSLTLSVPQDPHPPRQVIGFDRVFFMAGGRRLLSTAGPEHGVWDVETGEQVDARVSQESYRGMTFSVLTPGQDRLVIVRQDGVVEVRSLAPGGEDVDATLDGKLNAVAAHPDGRHIAVGLEDGSVRLLSISGPSRLGRNPGVRLPVPFMGPLAAQAAHWPRSAEMGMAALLGVASLIMGAPLLIAAVWGALGAAWMQARMRDRDDDEDERRP